MKKHFKLLRLRTLRAKIILSSTIAATIPTVAIIFFLSKYFIGEMRDGLEMKAKSQVNLIASNMRSSLDFDDKSTAAQIADNAQKDEDVTYISVFKRDGTTMVELGTKHKQKVPIYKKTRQLKMFDTENTLNIAQPIDYEGKHYGVVQMGFSLSRLKSSSNRVRLFVFISGLLLAAFVTIALTFLFGTSIVRSVKNMTVVARSLASGDLDCPALMVKGQDEIAQLSKAIDQMADSQRMQVSAIKEAANHVLKSSTELRSTTSQLAAAASEQATAVTQTTTTLEEIKQTGKLTKESAHQIVESSEKSVTVSSEGLQAVDASTGVVRQIREQVEGIVKGVEGLRTRVSEVGDIITTVNEIADQAKLLAVNASIEAAKASEYGRGFAVVAQEVKELALQSKQATAQVRNTLLTIQNSIEEVFRSAQSGSQRTEAGVQSIEHTGQVIQRLIASIANAAEDARRIAINANEQVIGLEQAALAMSSVNKATMDNMTSSRQMEQSGETLNNMAKNLEKLVANYKLTAK